MTLSHLPSRHKCLTPSHSRKSFFHRPGKEAYKILDTFSTTSPSKLVPKTSQSAPATTTSHNTNDNTPGGPAIVDSATPTPPAATSSPDSEKTLVAGMEKQMSALDMGQ